MKFLLGILGLADSASESDVSSAVRSLVADRDRLKAENATLKDRIDTINADQKKAQKDEAVALVDTAVKDGRIDAKAKDSYLKLFDQDFDSAKAVLEAIPVRQSVVKQIEMSMGAGAVGLADLQNKSWDELDREEKLTLLKDSYPDLYKSKFKERFGVEPKI
jgi:regulator of replication initiation timing